MSKAKGDPAGCGCYEIRVRGRLGETLLSAFPGLRAKWQGDETILAGALADQAALHGVLAQIEALGLDLLEVHRLAPSETNQPPGRVGRVDRRESPASGDDGSPAGRRVSKATPSQGANGPAAIT